MKAKIENVMLNVFDREADMLTIKNASFWASKYLKKNITVANISYLIQYGHIKKYFQGQQPFLKIKELKAYYDSFYKEENWKKTLGVDINWQLSFEEYKESETTKHVHRLHPYKGKFIPQLVEYFIDSHTDEFKKEACFQPGDVLLDPFCGSGTALVQANELNMHAVGVDISMFNSVISNVKIAAHDQHSLAKTTQTLNDGLQVFQKQRNIATFDSALKQELSAFNQKYFGPEYKRQVRNKKMDEKSFGLEKEKNFLGIYNKLVAKHQIRLAQNAGDSFLDQWFLFPIREEIDYLYQAINQITDEKIKQVLIIIMTRAIRSCRATSHADLGTLKKPILATYYCRKHGKICKPLFSLAGWFNQYSKDTLNRLNEFGKIKSPSFQVALAGDSRNIDLVKAVALQNDALAKIIKKQKIKGVFSSPPYLGLINYHEQHAYAYDLFDFQRNDHLEIGSLDKGQGNESKQAYVANIAKVLVNCQRFLQKDYHVFLVANDKHNLYPKIAEQAGMRIVNQFKRPVLNRVEKDRLAPYAETIFHLQRA